MSKEERIIKFKNSYEQFKNSNPRDVFSVPNTFTNYDGLSFDETKNGLEEIISILDEAIEIGAMESITWNAYNSLDSLMQTLLSGFAQFRITPDQNSFQNLSQYVDSMLYHLKMFGVVDLVKGGAQLAKTSSALRAELGNLLHARTEAEQLSSEVKTLIAPAIAGSLSQSFTSRKDALYQGRKLWGFALAIISLLCIWLTYDFANKMTLLISPSSQVVSDATNLVQNSVNVKKDNGIDSKINAKSTANSVAVSNLLWIIVLMRTVVLIPAYVLFVFAFGQYRKERDFEEEYAHKAAVATSLPNYGDLAREPSVRDQIVTGATNVIFSSPINYKVKESNEKTLRSVKELFDSLAKLLPHKD